MTIRPAKKTDYEHLVQLYNGLVESNRYSKHDNDSFQQVLENPNSYIYVLELKDTLIGFISFSICPVVRYPKPNAEVDEFYVDTEYRKQGLGQKLLQTALDKATELNCHRIFIESHYKHKSAHKLYEKMDMTNYSYHFIKNL
jgi:L-amino acid N-acyltransferase YncA